MPQPFKCPSCGGPLVYDGGDITVRCPYCTNSVIVPEEIRPVHVRLHQHWPNPALRPALQVQRKGLSTRAWAALIVGIVTVVVLVVVGGLIFSAVRSAINKPHSGSTPSRTRDKATTTTTTTASSGFASVLLEFGSEGIGAGQFKDARSIAVDGEGNIYVGEYTGGRVQVFDASGKFVTQWMVDAKMPLLQLAADRKGTVYVVQSGDISRYEGLTGKPLGKLPSVNGSSFISDMVLTIADEMVVVQHGEDLVRLDASGRVVRTIKAAISEQSGDSELSTRVAVDGLGNIYALGRFNNAVFKFGPNGKYITRFGGKGNQPGQLGAPYSIAVDGQGRVYVGDFDGLEIFDTNGRYLDTFKLEHNLPFGLVFNDKNELFIAARTQAYKLAINKP